MLPPLQSRQVHFYPHLTSANHKYTTHKMCVISQVSNGSYLSLEAIPTVFFNAIAQGIQTDREKRKQLLPFQNVGHFSTAQL